MKTTTNEPWTINDQRIRDIRVLMDDAENHLRVLRHRLNSEISARRNTLQRDDVSVCPICGQVVGRQVNAIGPHADHHGTRQCRGTGISLVESLKEWDGGL